MTQQTLLLSEFEVCCPVCAADDGSGGVAIPFGWDIAGNSKE